jgi:cytochrome P450
MLARIGNAVAAAVPDGSIVLVVSYGDEGLLQLKDKTGWHFPQDVDGFYSREYPEDGGVLVRHLRDMNAKGADYLIVPAGAFWLLEEYPDFAGYLDAHARRVVDDPELLIFGLTDATVDRANPADGHTPASHETSPSPEQIGERPRVLPLDHMPVITIPPDYVTEMPRFMARMAVELGPIFRRQVPRKRQAEFGQWIVYMVGPEANRFVMHTHREHFSHDLGWTPTLTPNFERGLLNMDDPEHARDRKMMNPAFDMAHMSAYLPIITQVIADRTRDWLERGEVDLADESRKITFDIVAEALAGLQRGPQVDALRDLFYRVSRRQLSARLLGADTFVEARAELDALLLGLIRDRRAEPGDDILGMLVRASDEQGVGFTDQQLLGHLHILLAAGHETTTSLASTLLYLLTIHPEYLARVHAEIDEFTERTGGVPTIRSLRSMKVLGNALNEAGRLGTAGNGPRGVVTDFEFGGYRVPAGTRVVLSLAGGHHLPTVFRDPEKFDPDRFDPPREEHKNPPYSFVPFGGGNRPCIGMNLAQVEIKALALHVLRNYHLDVIEGQEIAQTYYAEEASIYPYGINVRVTPRA